ncbi:MAG: mannose-1-phosphate guanylyltransferase [Bacteroidales bacterium]|jgi:mannose-1-phosphate guanylyltransferase|nr:mannose-1-phosphate guanylyltransferase [Bacteroidales bacterium]
MNKNHYCVIMAGGVGERFWPISKVARPKQFIDILGTGQTLAQQTFERLSRFCPKENILIVINEQYRSLVNEQLPQLPDENILCEPARRNTAPCIAYACHKIAVKNPNAVVLTAPSDHVILKEDAFIEAAEITMKAASENHWLLTMGIAPSRPETGYGYIKYRDGSNPIPDMPQIYKVSNFTEKPNIEIAKQFLASGDYLWNAGIFIWSIPSILEALQRHLPEINELFDQIKSTYYTSDEKTAIQRAYAESRSISIDYGVMEKADNAYVLKTDFGWSDLGTWGSLYAHLKKNGNLNVIFGDNVLEYDTMQCLVQVPNEKLVVLQGLEGYVIVENEGVLLICKKDEEKRLREVINEIRLRGGERYL